MKKLGLLSCLLGLFVGFTTTVHAEKHPLCTLEPPASCFFAIQLNSRVYEKQSLKEKSYPGDPGPEKHCPVVEAESFNHGIGMLPGSSVLDIVYKKLTGNTEHCDDKNAITLLQEKLGTACKGVGNPDGNCRPATVTNNKLDVICTGEHYADGKYGLCTQEAVRRYLEYFKVSTTECDDKPQLVITTNPQQINQGEETTITVTETNGKAYKWENESNFIAIEDPLMGDALKIKDIKLMINNESQIVALGEKIPHIFPSSGKETLYASEGISTAKPSLEILPGENSINVIAIEASTKTGDGTTNTGNRTPADLGCKQLLPKYLVGASCDTSELKGDARDITYWIQKFSGKITTFIAAIAVVLIAWNAFGLVMAGGEADQISTIKKALVWVGVGLLLTIFAYVIVKTAISLSFLQ